MASWFRKLFAGAKPAVAEARPEAMADDDRAEMERVIGGMVAGGYRTPQQILESVSDYMGDSLDARTIALQAGPMLERALIAHEVASRTWPAVTDYDRLHRAFAALEDRGVVARENFTCCGTCGAREIWDEIDAARSGGAQVTGYAFFHMQDTESATEGDGLYLNYGAVEAGERAALDVAATIVGELERNGLHVDWNGSWSQRIGVKLDWQRRREPPDAGRAPTLH